MNRREYDRRRYATNPASRARQRARQNRWERAKYANDPELRAKQCAHRAEQTFFQKGWGFRPTITGG